MSYTMKELLSLVGPTLGLVSPGATEEGRDLPCARCAFGIGTQRVTSRKSPLLSDVLALSWGWCADSNPSRHFSPSLVLSLDHRGGHGGAAHRASSPTPCLEWHRPERGALRRAHQMKSGRRPRFVTRGRERSLWLLLAVVLAPVLWTMAQVLGWPVWARAVLSGLVAAAPLIVSEWRARAEQDHTRARLLDQRVAVSGGHRQLLRVRAVRLDQLRVYAARVQVPYIERDQQTKLEKAVG